MTSRGEQHESGPDGPSAMQFWRLSIHSQRISSRTSALFSAGEVERIEALGLGETRQPNAPLHVAALAVDALEFAQAQQIARVIGAGLGRFTSVARIPTRA